MDTYKIESNIPYNPDKGLNKIKKTLKNLQPGDSFLVDFNDCDNVQVYVHLIKRELPKEWIIKTKRTRDKKSLRIWRIK